MTEKKKVVVIYGGRSAEHEVSCRSAAFVLKNLDKSKYEVHALAIDKAGRWLPQDTPTLLAGLKKEVPIRTDSKAKTQALPVHSSPSEQMLYLAGGDSLTTVEDTVVFPVLHGTYGEDGTLQGLLEMTEVAYVGSDHLGSSMGMDKDIAKRLVQAAGVPVVPWIIARKTTFAEEKETLRLQTAALGYPVFVKPANLGSSVGITKVAKVEDWEKALQLAFQFDTKVLIEKALRVREIECAVLGGAKPRVSVAGEVIPHAEFYSYEAKYIDAEGASLAVPADITAEEQAVAQHYAAQIFVGLELYGLARVDLFLEKDTGQFYFNEVNTLPGFTEISQYPMLWAASGVEPSELLDELITLAIDRRNQKAALKRTY